MTEVPIIEFDGLLVATVHEDLTDVEALAFQEHLNGRLERRGATGLLIDVAMVQTIDSFLGRLLREIALGARLLGAETVVAGMQPMVAMTLVELGLTLDGVKTALTPERGLAMLRGTPRRGRAATHASR